MRLFNWLTWRSRRDHELQEEIAAHLTLATKDRIAAGEDARAAEFSARKEFGNVTLTREATRLSWGGLWIDRVLGVVRDIRYAGRLLARSPGYSLVIITVLALGIACNVITFGLFKALALAPLAGVPNSGSLHYVGARSDGDRFAPISYPDYQYLRDRAYPDLAFWAIQPLILGQAAEGRRVFAEFVPGNYFDTLGVRPQLGRAFARSDEVTPGGHPIVVIADGLWRRTFGADPGIVGRTIHLNAQPLTVVGVANADFRGAIVGLATDVFVPVMMASQLTGGSWIDNRSNRSFHAFTRLRPGISRAQADAEAAIVAAALQQEHPIDWAGQRAVVVPIWQWPYGAQTYMLPAVVVMGVMAALLLVVVCANVAGLVLARSLTRQGEMAARLALGASRGRILRQLTTESLVLAVPGAILGFLLPALAEPFVGAAASNVPLPLYFNAYGDRFVVGFTLVLATLCVVLCGLGPALRVSRLELATVMKDDLSPRGPSTGRLRTSLVVAQIAVALLLLVGTGLMLRTLNAAQRADAGFDARQVSWASLDVRAGGHDEGSGRLTYQRLLDALRADRRVEAASVAVHLPLTIIDWQSGGVAPEGYQPRRGEDLSFAFNVVSPDYFRALRIPMAAGREFDARDDEAGGGVAIINETFARRFWASPEDAIGRRLESNWNRLTVVGVARDIKYARLDEAARPYFYLPFSQVYRPDVTLHVRATAEPAAVLDLVREHAHDVDPTLPILDAGVVSDQIRSAASMFETVARLLAIIGLVAAGLAGLGVYGLVAYTVKQRAHEIGIRTAIGATPGEVARRFVTGGAWVGLIGVVLGLLAAVGLTRLMSRALYGVAATDPVSFAVAAAAVFGVALAASFLPAWRAARGNPVNSLRHQ